MIRPTLNDPTRTAEKTSTPLAASPRVVVPTAGVTLGLILTFSRRGAVL